MVTPVLHWQTDGQATNKILNWKYSCRVFLSTILGCTNLSIITLMCIAHVHNTQCWRTYELQYLELTFFQIIDISRAMIIFRYCCLGNSCNTENYITLRCVNHNIRLNSFSRICEINEFYLDENFSSSRRVYLLFSLLL